VKIAINAINDNDRLRGPDRYTLELVRALSQVAPEHDFLLFHAPWQGWYPGSLTAPNIRCVRMSAPRSPYLRWPWQAAVFPFLVRRYGPDVVHLPNTIFTVGLGRRVVVTFHDVAEFTFPEKFDTFRARVRRVAAWAAARTAGRIVAVSDFTKGEMVRFLGLRPERITVVLEGATATPRTGLNAEAIRGKYSLRGDYLLYVGQIEKTKNVEGMVRAFARIRAALGPCDLILVGKTGNAYETVMSTIRDLDLGSVVRHLGYVPEDDLPGLFTSAKALVFPSLVEGFGLVMLEAMAYGVPVIASNAGSLPEVAGDAAVLVPPGDERALSDAMARVVRDDGLRESLSRKGQARASQFSWSRAARQMLGVYESLHPGEAAP